MKNLKQFIWRSLLSIPGFHTNRKIVVIESDDWGSIRMPSRDVYEKCLKAGYPVDLNPFERYDSLASETDLSLLFDLLSSFKDKNGKHPVITANCVVANPDFSKIRDCNFEQYHYELITETFKRYPNHSRNLDIWLAAKSDGLFFPQYHAREHLNVSRFMNGLQQADVDVLFGFENEMPGSIRKGRVRNGNYFVEATHFSGAKDKQDKLNIYVEGLGVFEKLFGYKSESITPTNYIWSNDYNKPTSDLGVKYIQGVRKMKDPNAIKPIYYSRYLGKQNCFGQIDLVRNCDFEPSIIKNKNVIDECLAEIQIAFFNNKPAIISSHRINYVGHIDVNNRDANLNYLNQILKLALAKWPDIEFMTSVDLGDLISDSYTKSMKI
jgi:hypothetical protein